MSGITKDEHGVYRWVYEFNLLTNPTILLTLLKIFLGIAVGFFLFMLLLKVPDFIGGYADMEDVWELAQFNGAMALILCGLLVVGYLFYAVMQGGKYCVVFTMDENGITHKQLPKQYKKAQVVSALNVIAGMATGNPTTAGIGLLSARDSLSSNFSVVRSIKGSRFLRVIKVNEPFAKNQVYVDPDDYDFVFNYIREHCPNAKKVRG